MRSQVIYVFYKFEKLKNVDPICSEGKQSIIRASLALPTLRWYDFTREQHPRPKSAPDSESAASLSFDSTRLLLSARF